MKNISIKKLQIILNDLKEQGYKDLGESDIAILIKEYGDNCFFSRDSGCFEISKKGKKYVKQY